MAENSQLSGNMKNSSTGTSSTDASSEIIGKHENEIVPHKISNHDKLVQTMVMVDGEWINVNDTNDQANMKDDMNKVNKKVVEAQKGIVEAKSAADSAAKAADSAVNASVVNSDAITTQSAAISEAKSAISSANAAIQQTAANAASDAAKIRADVEQVQSEVDTAKAANSASVEALKSDVSAAKQDLADVHDRLDQAQSAIEQNQKLINDSVAKITSDVSATKQDLATVHDSLTKAQAAAEQNQKAINQSIAQINSDVDGTKQDLAGVRKDLTKAQADITATQKSINDNVAQINADITQDRKDIASAQQANADTAKQLDTYSKQATEQGKTIKTIQDKQDDFTATLADVQGNVSQVSDKVDGLSASLKDAQGNVASVKAQADQLSATLTDHAKSIATLTASAKELSSTLEDADGRLSKVEQTAKTNSSTLADVQGDLSQVKQDATALTSTLKDAQGNISTLQQKTDSVSAQLASAQGDIATLQTGVDSVKATLASHDKSIHTLQADSKSLKDSMADAQGNISTLSKTATSLDSEMKDHAGRLSKVEQNAATQATTLSDLQGNLTQVKQQADGLVTMLKNAQGSITQIQQKADGTLAQLKSAQGDIASLQTDVTGIKATLTSHEGDIHTLQADSKTLKDDMTDAQGNISSLQKSSTKLDSEMSSQDGRLSKVEQTAKEHTSTISDLGKKVDSNGGGVNLLTNTQLFDYNWSWDQIGHSFASGVLTLDGNADATSRMFQQLTDNDITGKTFSVSFNARICADCDSASIEVDAGPYDATKRINITSKDFQRYKVENWQWNSSSIFFSFYVKNGRIDLTNLKLEYGAVATPYSLAPADLATISQVKQTADSITTTLKNVQGDVDQVTQKANGTSEQLADVQGNVTNIQKDVNGLKQTTTDNAGNIHTLQSDSKSLHDSMQDAQGDISTLKKTSTDVTAELQDHAGRISKTEQTAATLTNEFADQQGHLNRVEQKATGTEQTVANQQGQINSIQTDAAGIHETLTGQGNQIANINVTLSGLNTKYEGVSDDLGKLKDQTDWKIVTGTFDANQYTQTARIFYQDTHAKNTPNTGWFYLIVDAPSTSRITQTLIRDNTTDTWTRVYNGSWQAWTKGATNLDVTALSNRITTNSTQITQNKQAIALKADQSTVNNLTGEVSQNSAQLKVQAGQISSKVSSTDFKTLNDKVNGMQIGGRNLLTNTDKDISVTSHTTDSWPAWANVDTGFSFEHGKTYTFSTEAKNSTNKVAEASIRVFESSTNTQVGIYSFPADNKRHSITFSIPNDSHNYHLLLYAGHAGIVPGVNVTTTYHHPKLEEGNVATAWTPAPEDLTIAIQKNSTAIDQTNKQISLKADQKEVDKVKQTASQNSSQLDVMANEISSKVTSTDVNNIVDSKGYATTSTVQSLITQKAGTINESITNLTSKVNSNGGGVNLLPNSKDLHTGWTADGTSIYPVDDYLAVRATGGLQRLLINPTEDTKGKLLSVSFDACVPSDSKEQDVKIWVGPFQAAIGVVISGSNFKRYKAENWKWNSVNGAFSIQLKNVNDKICIKNIKLEFGPVATPYSPAPSDNATVTQVQEITASIDGLQSTVASKADKSQITQLSNVIQSKVSTSDFTSKVSQLSTDINARVTKGDLLSQINVEAGRTLIQSNKIYFDADSFVMSPNSKAFIPSAFITNLSADKITTGTLDASKLHVKNFSADNISGGTLSGITVKTGDKNRYFQTSKDSIYWVRDNKTSLIGTDQYINPSDGIVIADTHSVTLTTWYGATVKEDGTITNEAGNIGYPKLILDSDGKWDPDASGGSRWEGNTGKAQIGQWIADREYTNLIQGKGFVVHLDDQNKDSVFAIQKDYCVGAYFGQGEHGNQINFVTVGDDQAVNITGNFHVTGSKNSIVETKQGYLAINAYETAEYYFGDIGESNTGDTSQITIGIDRIFNETVNTDIQYQVFVTPYSDAHVWVEKRYNNRFVVKSDKPGAEFGWELKAKRKGYESNRLRRVNVDFDQANIKGDN